jgi:hypothetical protein
MAAPESAAALAVHRPVVQYDSLESYYTDWAAVISDRPGNMLKRADGTILAVAGPTVGNVPQLNLAFLQPQAYPSGDAVQNTDYIVEVGSDYVAQAREMHARPGYADKAHGRVVEQSGVVWLQYWFFMYYDDPGFLGLGRHEGDLEMIQIRLDPTGQPDVVSYAQHRSGVRATWSQVEQQGSSPVVYSARGTHASMLRSGELVSDRSFRPDHNDAGGPRVQLDLIVLSEAQTPWAFWPGRWGGTRPEDRILGDVGIEANSPTAPNEHRAWSDPAGFHAECSAEKLPPVGEPHTSAVPAPPPPHLTATLDPKANAVTVQFRIPETPAAAPAHSLVVGVDPAGGQSPPATTAIRLTGTSGQLRAPVPPGTTTVQVRATTHSADGTSSSTATAGS